MKDTAFMPNTSNHIGWCIRHIVETKERGEILSTAYRPTFQANR